MYEQLYAAWRREIDDNTLGGLAPDFYVKIADYLTHINEEKNKLIDKKTVKTNLLEHEAFNVDRMLKELLDLRYRKILKTVTRLRKVPTELLAVEEAKNCENFLGFAINYQEFAKSIMIGQQTPLISNVLQAEPQKPELNTLRSEYKPSTNVAPKRLTLRFTKPIPAIMGADMKSYGPFQAEDVASMPILNAQILIKQGLAVMVDVA